MHNSRAWNPPHAQLRLTCQIGQTKDSGRLFLEKAPLISIAIVPSFPRRHITPAQVANGASHKVNGTNGTNGTHGTNGKLEAHPGKCRTARGAVGVQVHVRLLAMLP